MTYCGLPGDLCEDSLNDLQDVFEYMYTSHSPDGGIANPAGVLKYADQYGLERLVSLCEIILAKHVEKCTTEKIEKADIDVIQLLLFAQRHNANQLAEFCLHFIAKSYGPFSKRPEFSLLIGENKKYVEEHQWPPLSYWDELDEYNQSQEASKGGGGGRFWKEGKVRAAKGDATPATSSRNRALRLFF